MTVYLPPNKLCLEEERDEKEIGNVQIHMGMLE